MSAEGRAATCTTEEWGRFVILTEGVCTRCLHQESVDGQDSKGNYSENKVNWGDFRQRSFEGDYADVGKEVTSQIAQFRASSRSEETMLTSELRKFRCLVSSF